MSLSHFGKVIMPNIADRRASHYQSSDGLYRLAARGKTVQLLAAWAGSASLTWISPFCFRLLN
jgi:vacuolar-type H+-ATPase subunit B/Vma2